MRTITPSTPPAVSRLPRAAPSRQRGAQSTGPRYHNALGASHAAAHAATTRGILSEAQLKGWRLTTTTHHADGRSEHSFTTRTHEIHVFHKGAERLTYTKGKGAPSHDQHAQNVKAINAAMRGVRSLGGGVTQGGRHVTAYETPTHSVVISHIGNEMTTITKPRGR
jgi:hypothetical protein